MAPRVLISLALCLLSFANISSAFSNHIADVGYARYLGNYTAPYSLAFLGVPYALSPVKNLRWRNPKPVPETIRNPVLQDARSYPNFCVQGSTGFGDAGGAGTEDCLNINIYTPVNATTGSNLPVLFYIHGGGYVYGNPANWPFEHWINFSPNVVIVSVYYRLSSLGFLAHPSFADGSQGDFNVGFKDQILALKWVKKHIHAFGGDPNHVTINGESAGGGSVALHLVANEGEQLFQGAIAQSVFRSRMASPQQTVPLFNYYAQKAGCNKATVAATMVCLRNAPISVIAPTQDSEASFNGSLYNGWLPAFDNQLFTQYPTVAFKNGNFRRVPIMVGSTSNESLIAPGADFNQTLLAGYPQLTPQDLAGFTAEYPADAYPSADLRLSNMFGEMELRAAREIIGAAGVQYSSAYTYRYNQLDPFNEFPPLVPGMVGHAAENSIMFLGTETGTNGSTVFHQLPPAMVAFSHELFAYWLSFVRSGNPNTYKLARSPQWPNYSTNSRIVLQGDPNNSTTVSGSFAENEPADEVERANFIASVAVDCQC